MRKITQHIDKSLAHSASLLEKTVNINKGTMNFDGVKKVGALYQAGFDAMGVETQWVDGAEFKRAGHTKDEIADMTSFAQNIHKAAVLIYRLGENGASMEEKHTTFHST